MMAIYEFECEACHKRFEIRILMSVHETVRQSPPVCPACGNRATRQVVSEFACKTPVG
jgi:putative FmdB family regulatory protein